jgi:hypothetical protein
MLHTLHRAWFDIQACKLFSGHRQRPVVLATLNAKYIHASRLRCLLANMDLHGGPGLRAQTVLRESVIGQRATQIVEDLALNRGGRPVYI